MVVDFFDSNRNCRLKQMRRAWRIVRQKVAHLVRINAYNTFPQ